MIFFSNKHPLRRARSFQYAFEGIFHALLNEPNFRIQILIVVVAAGFGIYFHILPIEWGLLTLSLGMLLSAEMINTVVEEVLDHFFKEKDPVVKIIKDLSAGYVLVTSGIALVILGLIFVPKIL